MAPRKPSFNLGAASGLGSGSSSGGGRRKSGRISASSAKAFASSIEPDAPKGGVTQRELDSLSDGGKQARKALEKIIQSDAPYKVKQQARRRYSKGGDNKSESFLSRAVDAVSDIVPKALMVVDKPKRAVVAALEEGFEATGGIEEDDDTWADNVLRKRDYGGGDLVRKTVKSRRGRDKADNAVLDFMESKWGGRATGLALDVALDPLTYVTAGASAAAKATGKAGAKVAFKEATKEGAGKAAQGATRATLKRGVKVGKKEAGRRLIDADEVASAAKVLRSNSTLGARGSELAEAGLEGGVKLFGQTVIPQDVVRALGGKQIASLKAAFADTGVAKGTRKVFGGNEELRTLLRTAPDDETVVRALAQLDSKAASALKGSRFAGKLGDRNTDLSREARKTKADGVGITDALRRGEESGDELALEYRKLLDDAGDEIEKLGGGPPLARRPNYVPRIRTEEANEKLRVMGANVGKHGEASFEKRALREGDDFMGERIGPVDDLGPVEEQVNEIAERLLGDDAVKLYEDDITKIVPAYLRQAQRRVSEKAEVQSLRDRGVIRPQALADPEAVPAGMVAQGGARAEAQLADAATMPSVRPDQAQGDEALSRLVQAEDDLAGAQGATQGLTSEMDDARGQFEELTEQVRAMKASADTDAATVSDLVGRRTTLARRIGAELPPKIKRSLGSEAKAEENLAQAVTAFGAADEAVRLADGDVAATVADLERRVDLGRQAAAKMKGARAARTSAAADTREQAAEIAKRIDGIEDPAAKQVAAMEVKALEADALADELGQVSQRLDTAVKSLRTPESQRALSEMLQTGIAQQFKLFKTSEGYDTTQRLGGYIGEEIPTDVLANLVKASEIAAAPGKLVKAIDAANRGFKTYALLTPGFHVRNSIGGIFNNAVAGVNPVNYGRFARSLKAYHKFGPEGINQVKDKDGFRAIQQITESGLFDDLTQVVDAADNPLVRRASDIRRTPGSKRKLTDNALTRTSRFAGDKVEDGLRGTLAFDRLVKGESWDGALEEVYRFHFNYSDLSDVERGMVRRVIPFWTWSSRNLSRQADFFLSNPRTYQRWNNAKAFLGTESSDSDKDPEHLKGVGTIPWGPGKYLRPDLPFASADESLRRLKNPIAFALQDSTPFVKAPIETVFNTQFFSEMPLSQRKEEAPDAWRKIPGLMPALVAGGLAEKDRDGRYIMSGEDAYTVEQANPLFGRVRRLFPSEEKYNERAGTAWLSFIGIGSATSDKKTREAEMYRRADELKKLTDSISDQGYIVPTADELRPTG